MKGTAYQKIWDEFKNNTGIIRSLKVPVKIDSNWKTPGHIVLKMTNFKDRDHTLKAARSKNELTK